MNKTNIQIKRLSILLAVLCLPAGSLLHAAEPVYNGKALSEWLVTLQTNSSDAEAIRQIGTNGLPTLLDIIGIEQWNRKKVLGKLKSRDFREAAGNKKVSPEVFRGLAVDGFSILGTNAEPAIPQLTKLLYKNSECRLEVANALTQIGPKGFAVLTNAFTDEDLAGVLVLAIGQKGGGDLQTVTKVLICALKSPNPIIRGNAADFLSGKDAALAVPALIPMLDDTEYYPRVRTAIALESFGPAAKSAAPRLLSVYTNVIVGQDRNVAFHLGASILHALRAIDPQTAARAEEFLVNSGPLNSARRGYSRTTLSNGIELIAGGVIDTKIFVISNHFLASAQLLDPKTGKWTETGKMNTARFDHKTTLLPDGKVLVEGGHGAPSIPGRFPPFLSSAELYDPSTGTWTVVTNK
jgi:hypothetical protein